jgi:amidase
VRELLELIKVKRVPGLRMEQPGALIAVQANRPLEVAVETATMQFTDWLISEHGLTPTDAYCLVNTCPDFRINVYQTYKIGERNFVVGEAAQAVSGSLTSGTERSWHARRQSRRRRCPYSS